MSVVRRSPRNYRGRRRGRADVGGVEEIVGENAKVCGMTNLTPKERKALLVETIEIKRRCRSVAQQELEYGPDRINAELGRINEAQARIEQIEMLQDEAPAKICTLNASLAKHEEELDELRVELRTTTPSKQRTIDRGLKLMCDRKCNVAAAMIMGKLLSGGISTADANVELDRLERRSKKR